MKWGKRHLIFIYLFYYLFKYVKIVYETEDLLQKQNNKFSLFNTHWEFISYNIDKIVFILINNSSGFFFQFDACLIYCFHCVIWFNFVSDVLIVVNAARIYLSEVKLNIYLFFFMNQLLFCNWINRCILYFLIILLFIKLFW